MNPTGPSRNRAFAPRPGRGGFTLVEIMIAFAIFSMLVAAVFSTWTLLLRSKQVGNEAAARAQRQRIAIRTLEDSLTCVQSFQASPAYYSFVVQNGEQPLLSFVARLPAGFPRNARFGDFNLRRLTFTLEPGPDSEKDLVLRQNPILMDMDSDEKAFPLVLARNVQGFVVECWDTNKLDWVDEWLDTNSIPPLLRISLVPGGGGGYNGEASSLVITRVIAAPSMMMPSVLQAARGGGAPGGINLNPGNAPGGPPSQGPPGATGNPNAPGNPFRPNRFNR
ncbi:MAG TPA: prepilin-type N-terminal cleavage/methylation domain-containing protein [Candidatus Acidoferrum sp.]|nr:prepilin-type N-terminal cleavage/methylation domain-containing protein [Candidatus Acidoferrum sp.]